MPFGFGDILSFAAPVIGSFLSHEGQSQANTTNVLLAREATASNVEQAQLNRDFSAAQAQRQMDFQERMSGTAYQRAVSDMQQAGLNPMLAYSQGGASSPSGAQGAGSQASAVPGHVENEYAPAVSSALSAATIAAQVEKLQAETRNVDADTAVKLKDAPLREAQTIESHTRSTLYGKQQSLVQAQAERIGYQNDLTEAQVNKVKAEVKVLAEEQGIRAAELMLKRFDLIVREATSAAEVNQAIAESRAWATDYGQTTRPYVRDFQGTAGGASSVLRALPFLRR